MQLTCWLSLRHTRVIRHEENSKPCDITCNGRYNNAWSKTMVGYEDEAIAYCLEVAYNYGVYEYEVGSALISIGLAVPDVTAAISKAQELGYTVEGGNTIVGPDKYRYELSALAPGRKEPFQFIKLNVSDIDASASFYTQTLGMSDLTKQFSASGAGIASPPPAGSIVVGYSQGPGLGAVPLVLVPAVTGAVIVEEYSGRHALSLPEAELLRIYEEIGGDVAADEADGSSSCLNVVHAIRTFHEVDPVTGVGLGDLRAHASVCRSPVALWGRSLPTVS